MAMTVSWRTPAQIDAEVARLQAEIRQARERAVDAGPGSAAYREAVGRVTAATRTLAEFEDVIPALQEGYRRRVGTRIMRWAGWLLTLEGVGGAVAAGAGVMPFWWLFPAVALAAAGLFALPGAGRRATDPALRPRLGALSFGFAGAFAVVCVTKLIPPAAVLVAFAAAWLGLRAFRVFGIESTQEAR